MNMSSEIEYKGKQYNVKFDIVEVIEDKDIFEGNIIGRLKTKNEHVEEIKPVNGIKKGEILGVFFDEHFDKIETNYRNFDNRVNEILLERRKNDDI